MNPKVLITGAIIGVCAIGNAIALNVCAHSNTKVLVLNKTINGKSTTYDTANKVWKVTFDYTSVNGNTDKEISGMTACNDISGTIGNARTNLVTDANDVGSQCWCKMEPVADYNLYTGLTSYWVLYNTYTDAATCASDCTADCANAFSANTDGFRMSIFNAIK